MDSNIADTWIVAEDGIAMATSVVDSAKFVTVERMIKVGDGAPEMIVMPFARGDELNRLITALQRASDGQEKVESTVAEIFLAGTLLAPSKIVNVVRRLLHIEGRTVSIGIVILVLFVLFVGGR